jgi:hypothetical protein
MHPYKLKSSYSFNTHAPAILGASVRNATLIAILDYDVATSFITPNTSHANVFPHLPSGTPNNPQKYTYLLFQTENGNRIVYANVWIDEATIKEKTTSTLTVVIENAVGGDETKIRDLLALSGYKFEIILG